MRKPKYRSVSMDRKVLHKEIPLEDLGTHWAFPQDIIVEIDKKAGVARLYKVETLKYMV